MTRHARAVALLVGVAALSAVTLAAFPEPSVGGETRTNAGIGRTVAPPTDTPDVHVALAQHRALATRDVGRSAERTASLAGEAEAERREAERLEAERLAAIEAARVAEAARKAAEEAARIAAEKAAEEKAAAERAAAEQAAPEVTATKAAAPSVALPVSGYTLTARFGQCGKHWANCHTGLDFAAPSGTTVRAVAAGRVIEAGDAGAYGSRIVVDHGNGTTSAYCHLSAFLVTGGDVAAGEAIGRVGTTGNSTGPHLHLELVVGGTPVDPETWLRDRGINP